MDVHGVSPAIDRGSVRLKGPSVGVPLDESTKEQKVSLSSRSEGT